MSLFHFPLIVSVVNFDISLRSLSAANMEPLPNTSFIVYWEVVEALRSIVQNLLELQ